MNENNIKNKNREMILYTAGAFLISLFLILTQSYPLLGLIIMPLYLLKVWGMTGTGKLLLVYGAGMIPYFTGGLTEGISVAVPVLLTALALILISGKKIRFPYAIAIMSLAIILSVILNMMIMVISKGTDVFGMFKEITEVSKKVTQDIMTNSGVTLPESQKNAIKETLDSMTPEVLFDRTFSFVIQYGILAAYIVLRRSGKMLSKDRTTTGISTPETGSIKINPILMAIVFASALAGTAMKSQAPFFRTMSVAGYGMVDFLSLAGAGSIVLWFLNNRTQIKGSLLKTLIMAAVLMVTGSDMRIIVTMLDSVLDFRNLTGKSIWKYLMWKLFLKGGDKK